MSRDTPPNSLVRRERVREKRREAASGFASAVGSRGARTVVSLVLLAALLLLAGVTPARAWTPYPDVPEEHPYYTAIEYLWGQSAMSGFLDGTFRPDTPVTRQQFAKIIVSILDLPVSEADLCPFGDVVVIGPGSLYPDNYVAAAFFHGITKGTSPKRFSPYRSISRAQVVTMVVRAVDAVDSGYLHRPDAAFKGAWGDFDPDHQESARIAEHNHLLDGIPLEGMARDPWAPMTRAEMAQVLFNVDQLMRHRPAQAEWARVTEVIDGATLQVTCQGNSEVVRLIGLGELEAGRPFADETKALLVELLCGGASAAGDVLLEFDQRERDEVGRLLAYVWLPWDDGSNRYTLLNVDMVYRGLTYPRYLGTNILHRDWALEAMSQASTAHLNMWATSGDSPIFNRSGSFGPPETPLEERDDTLDFEVDGHVSLDGWRLEDGAGHVYWFPARSYEPGEYFTLHTGHGADSATHLYWNATEPIWAFWADVARLYDADGRLVAAWFI